MSLVQNISRYDTIALLNSFNTLYVVGSNILSDMAKDEKNLFQYIICRWFKKRKIDKNLFFIVSIHYMSLVQKSFFSLCIKI